MPVGVNNPGRSIMNFIVLEDRFELTTRDLGAEVVIGQTHEPHTAHGGRNQRGGVVAFPAAPNCTVTKKLLELAAYSLFQWSFLKCLEHLQRNFPRNKMYIDSACSGLSPNKFCLDLLPFLFRRTRQVPRTPRYSGTVIKPHRNIGHLVARCADQSLVSGLEPRCAFGSCWPHPRFVPAGMMGGNEHTHESSVSGSRRR